MFQYLKNLSLGEHLESIVAAYFQCFHLYVEKNLIDRQEEEILEIDLFCTDYKASGKTETFLVEVKSGKWGFPDIFKLIGWSKYLKIDNIILIVKNEDRNKNHDFYKSKGREIGVLIKPITDHKNLEKISEEIGLPVSNSKKFDCNYLSQSLEKRLVADLGKRKKKCQSFKSYKLIDKYLFTINSGIFFEENILKKVYILYQAYQKNLNITAKLGYEIENSVFDESVGRIPNAIFDKTFNRAETSGLNISTYVEFRARLAVLKAGIDLIISEEAALERRIDERFLLYGHEISLKSLIPQSFFEGLERIRSHEQFHIYPVFWQKFLWVFGGFILEDYKEHEYRLLSECTGIKVNEVDSALSALDLLFPTSKGWFREGNHKSRIRILKVFSVPFMGVGATLRLQVYGNNKNFSSFDVTGCETERELDGWRKVCDTWLKN